MMIDAMTFDVGGAPSARLSLVSSDGLAPLSIPVPSKDALAQFRQSLPQTEAPLPDVRRGLAALAQAMEASSSLPVETAVPPQAPECSPREAAPREAAPREAAPREAAPRDTAPYPTPSCENLSGETAPRPRETSTTEPPSAAPHSAATPTIARTVPAQPASAAPRAEGLAMVDRPVVDETPVVHERPVVVDGSIVTERPVEGASPVIIERPVAEISVDEKTASLAPRLDVPTVRERPDVAPSVDAMPVTEKPVAEVPSAERPADAPHPVESPVAASVPAVSVVEEPHVEPQTIAKPVVDAQPQVAVTPVPGPQPQMVETPVVEPQVQVPETPVADSQPQVAESPTAVSQPQVVETPVAVSQPQVVETPVVGRDAVDAPTAAPTVSVPRTDAPPRPDMPTDVSASASEKPAVAVEKPAVASEKPAVAVEKPAVAVEKTMVVEKPIAAEKPSVKVAVEDVPMSVEMPQVPPQVVAALQVAAETVVVQQAMPTELVDRAGQVLSAEEAVMRIKSITYELGGNPPVQVQLVSSEGLAPLPIPRATARFAAAMARKDEPRATETPLVRNPLVAPPPLEAGVVDQPAAASVSAASARTAAVAETVNEIVETVVDRIAVTPALAQGEGEIHITLRPTVLDGSSIRLTAKGGELTVVVAPATPQAAQLAASALPRLELALAEHAPAFRHVAVVLATAKKGKSDEVA